MWVTYLDIKELFCKHWRALVHWLSGTIEHSTQHFDGHGHSEYITGELTSGAHVIDVGASLKDLNQKVSSWLLHLPIRRLVYP